MAGGYPQSACRRPLADPGANGHLSGGCPGGAGRRDKPKLRWTSSSGSAARASTISRSIDLDIPRDKLVVITGPVGLGQVLARLRYHLRRRPAALRRVPVGLCAPVPRADAEARRRPDRRPVAGDLDRAEDDLEEPALDRRHRHRDLRLHAPAVRPRRCPLFARDRPADRGQTVSQMVDRIMALPEGTRLYLLAPDRARPQGRVPEGARRAAARGLPAGQDRRRLYELDDAPALNKKLKHDIEVVVDRWSLAPGLEQRLADSLETALKLADGLADRRERGQWRAAGPLGRNSPARSRASPSRRSSPACSASTPRTAPARPATASARLFLTPTWSSPTRNSAFATARSSPGSNSPSHLLSADAGRHRQALQGAASTRPGRTCREAMRDVILHGSGAEQVELELRRRLRRFSTKQAVRGRACRTCSGAGARPRAPGCARSSTTIMSAAPCEACGGHAPQARGARGQDRRPAHQPGDRARDRERGRMVRTALHDKLTAKQNEIARRDPQGDQRAARLPEQRRPRLSHARPHPRHALRRREPAHPPGLADRLGPDRRALRARRAVDRPAPARQRPAARDAEAPARPRQHRARRRARRGRDPRRPTI